MIPFLMAVGIVVAFVFGFICGTDSSDKLWRKWCIKVRLARHNPTTGEFEVIPERFPAETHKAAKEAAE